jgi:hypothetical protein
MNHVQYMYYFFHYLLVDTAKALSEHAKGVYYKINLWHQSAKRSLLEISTENSYFDHVQKYYLFIIVM